MSTTPRNLRCTVCGRGPSYVKDSTLEQTGVCSPCMARREAAAPVVTCSYCPAPAVYVGMDDDGDFYCADHADLAVYGPDGLDPLTPNQKGTTR